jgi:cephalosporin hydroxylase
MLKAIARQIPAIDRLIKQRDDLLSEVVRLRDKLSNGHRLESDNWSPHDRRDDFGGAHALRMNTLAERYYGSDGNRKPPIYLAEYEKLFGPMRNTPLRLLELGVRFGASMFLWSDYFPNATIVGLDIDDKPKDFPADKRVHFVQGRQDDPAALDSCAAIAGGQFDIIVDDASHIGRLSAASFSYLFPQALTPGGYYIIEDICTAFLPEFPDFEPFAAPKIGSHSRRSWLRRERRFPSHQAGMVGVVKQLFDHVMAPVAQGGYSTYPIERMLVLTNIAIMQKAA